MRRYKRTIKNKKGFDYSKVIKDLTRRTNKKIESLSKKGYQKRSQAYSNLLGKLDNNKINAITKQGKVRNYKNVNSLKPAQKRALRNSLESFLNAQTSTKAGINKRDRNIKEGIKKLFKDDNITDKQATIMAEMFKNEDFNKLANKSGGSDILIVTYDTIMRQESKSEFIQNLKDYHIYDKTNEKELIELLNLYDKLI